MSRLTIYADSCPDEVERTTEDGVEIATWLAEIGVTFERWRTHAPLAADAPDEDVCQAYAADIARLKGLGGYRSVDIDRLLPDNPAAPQMRHKTPNNVGTRTPVAVRLQHGGHLNQK